MNKIHTGVWIKGFIFSLMKHMEERGKSMERKGNPPKCVHRQFWKQVSKGVKGKSLFSHQRQTKSDYVVR